VKCSVLLSLPQTSALCFLKAEQAIPAAPLILEVYSPYLSQELAIVVDTATETSGRFVYVGRPVLSVTWEQGTVRKVEKAEEEIWGKMEGGGDVNK
jgi:hypothetical protein